MKRRLVIIPIDSILELFKDYAGLIAVPDDAQAEKLLLNEQDRLMALQISAESYPGNQPMEQIRFDLQRTYVVN